MNADLIIRDATRRAIYRAHQKAAAWDTCVLIYLSTEHYTDGTTEDAADLSVWDCIATIIEELCDGR